MPNGPARSASRSRELLAGLGLLLLTAAAYTPAYRAGFVWDDDAYVTENQVLRTTDGLRRMWTEPASVPQYYPLVFTTFWIEYHLWGLHPLGYHIVNVLLHGLNAVLLWRLVRRLEAPGAWVIAAVFALHPVCVESVIWVTERKNTLSVVFYLCAVLAYLRFRPLNATPPSGRRALWYALALLAYLAVLLSKTAACSLPAALLLLAWWKRGRLDRHDVRPLIPFFVMGLALGAVTIRTETTYVGAAGAAWSMSFTEHILVAGRAVWFYASKLLWPRELTFVYERWVIDARQWWQYIYPAAAVGLVLVLWLLRRRIGRGPLTAVLFFGGTLLPALGFIGVYFMRYSFVADHFQYLASLGLITLVVGLAAYGLGRNALGRRAAPVLAALLLLALGVRTWRQARSYDDVETLWRDTLAQNPGASIAWNNLGIELRAQERSQEAIPCFETALRQRPQELKFYNNLANVFAELGRNDDAIRTYQAALRQVPDSAITHFNLGTTLAQLGRLDEGIQHLRAALRLIPQHAPTRQNLTQAVLQRASQMLMAGDRSAATTLLTQAAQELPESQDVRALLAEARDVGATRPAP